MSPIEPRTPASPTPESVVQEEPRRGLRERRALVLEVILVQLVAWGWGIPLSVWAQAGSPERAQPAAAETMVWTVSTLLFDVGVAVLVLYLMWRTAGSLEPAGLTRLRWWQEFVWAVAILAAAAILVPVLTFVADVTQLPRWTSEVPAAEPRTRVFALLSLAGAFFEEVCFRAYLIRRLEQLLRQSGWAVAISALVFAAYHVPSPARAFELFGVGLLLGVAFLTWRRLPRLVLAHWAWNLIVY